MSSPAVELFSSVALSSERLSARLQVSARRTLAELCERIGVTLDGPRAHDIRIKDERACAAIVAHGSLGFGESYMNGWWECDAIDELVARIFRAGLADDRTSPRVVLQSLLAAVTNRQALSRAGQVAAAHYDLGNDLFEKMLDPAMVYSCGYWAEARDLAAAQQAKLDLVCRKLDLRPGMRVLDIGCGFGSFMKYAATRYGVSCVGYSVSSRQTEYARASCRGLPVEVVLDDYRNIRGTYDRVVSIGMLEAVGYKNFRDYMDVIRRALVPDGAVLLHTVGHNVSTHRGDPWIDRYIFPNGMLPSIAQLGAAIEGRFVMEDWHNFGEDYATTLRAWNERFQAAWPELSARYSPEFKRMWELYLLSFAGGFTARAWQLWHIVLTRPGTPAPHRRRSS